MKKVDVMLRFVMSVCFAIYAGCSVARETAVGDSGLDAMRSILSKHELKLGAVRPGVAEAFCRRMFAQLKNGDQIEVIVPSVQTDNPKDPRLARYEVCSVHDFSQNDERRGGPSEAAFYGLSSTAVGAVGDRNYRLYVLNNDKSSRDVDEIIYADWSRERRMTGEYHGGYFSIDTEKCEVDGGVIVEEEPLNKKVQSASVEKIDLLVKREADYFIVNLWDLIVGRRRTSEEAPQYWLNVWQLSGRRFNLMCSWNEAMPASGK
jgi:hypothetical protein